MLAHHLYALSKPVIPILIFTRVACMGPVVPLLASIGFLQSYELFCVLQPQTCKFNSALRLFVRRADIHGLSGAVIYGAKFPYQF